MRTAAPVQLEHVTMAFGDRPVFNDLSCVFPGGRISVVLGGSGSGKSTLLRLIGGLIRPLAGRILVDGEDVTRLSERALFSVRRKLGMLFQGGALLDSMTVFDNLAFPLREHDGLDDRAVADAVHDRLRAVGLRDVDALLPSQLSGGMVKRVALARAIIRNPAVLLCDEPLSGLDPISARRIEALLVEINRTRGITVVVVSHDVDSTMRVAEHILLLLPDGTVQGSPGELQASTDHRVRAFLNPDLDAALAMEDAS
jgi:phospholipid/cholesterol/gamma-HCH transport system ATP-binding protein